MKTTTLYSLNLVQLDYLSIRPLAADSVAESARAVQMAIDHWLLEQHKLGLFPPILRFGRHRQFRWAIINPAGLNTGSN